MMWEDSAPSNIALIKYMGKKSEGNVPANASVSWTLDHLRSFVQVEDGASKDDWEVHPNYSMILNDKGKEKFLHYFQFLKEQFGIKEQFFTIRSGNNFPSDCGIASSASSFAALTKTAAKAFCEILEQPKVADSGLAQISRRGSGSSCRSFFPGWVEWKDTHVEPIESDLNKLEHMVVIVSGDRKKVSSSEAHQKVTSSLLYKERAYRANYRYNELKVELEKKQPNWKKLFELSWSDFWDMHALFETSEPSFGYMSDKSIQIINRARQVWEAQQDGPIVTMDAGPNVHLLWRKDQLKQAQHFKQHELDQYQVISSGGLNV